MKKSVPCNRLLEKMDGEDDQLVLQGSTVGDRGAGEPCVTAATDSMAESATWVYLTLEGAVAEIVETFDDVSVDDWAVRIRASVERGIERGRKARL
jgi:hypothetical protein